MLQDTSVVVPVITDTSSLVLYLTTLVSGLLSGAVLKILHIANDKIKGLNNIVQAVVLAGLSFLVLKGAVFFGYSLPANPLGWDSTAVNTLLSTILGFVVIKLGVAKKPVA